MGTDIEKTWWIRERKFIHDLVYIPGLGPSDTTSGWDERGCKKKLPLEKAIYWGFKLPFLEQQT